jgi:hypothetical protein
MAATAIPIVATITTVMPATGAGSKKRRTASNAMAQIAISRKIALSSAARIDERRRP